MRIETSNSASYQQLERQPGGPSRGAGAVSGVVAGDPHLRPRWRSDRTTADGWPQEVEELADPILEELLDSINRNALMTNKRLQFLVHETSGRVQLRVLERGTDELIREVPSEQLLDLVGRLHDLIGLLVDETA